MSLTVGRCTLNSPQQLATSSGGKVRISALVTGTTEAEFQALCFVCAGYPNPDEPWVPIITGSELVGVTGMYAIESMGVGRTNSGEASWSAEVDISAVKAPSFASPLAQLSMYGHLRTNGQSWTTTTESYALGLPTAVQEVSGLPTSGTWATIDGDGGDVKLWYKTSAGFDADVLYSVPPSDWYDASAKIEAKLGGGSTWYDVPGVHIENLPTSVRIGNNLGRATLSTSGGYLIINTEHFDGTQWATAKDWRVSSGPTVYGQLTGVFGAAVLYNTPAVCALRFACTTNAGPTAGRVMLDVAVRRGIRNIECTLKSDLAEQWTVERATTETGQAIPGGIAAGVRANANDANGNRYLLICPEAHTRDTVQGGVAASAGATTFRFCLSSEITGSSASAPDDYVTLRRLYFGATAEPPVEIVVR